MTQKKESRILFVLIIAVLIALIFVILPNMPEFGQLPASNGEATNNINETAAENSLYPSLLITFYLFSRTSPGDLFKSIRILFSDFYFDEFVIREIASWSYATGMITFFNYFLKGIFLGNLSMIGISVASFIIFRVAIEFCITSFTTAENTSKIAKR